MLRFRTTAVVFLGFAFVGCSQPDKPEMPSAEDDLAAISAVRDGLTTALESGDVPGIMAGLTGDHLTMPPDQPAPPDNQALAAWHENSTALYTFHGDFTTDDIQLYGDLAIERWSGTTRLVPKGGGEEINDSSKGVWIWKRQMDGSWKLHWSVWNSNLPAEEALVEVGG